MKQTLRFLLFVSLISLSSCNKPVAEANDTVITRTEQLVADQSRSTEGINAVYQEILMNKANRSSDNEQWVNEQIRAFNTARAKFSEQHQQRFPEITYIGL